MEEEINNDNDKKKNRDEVRKMLTDALKDMPEKLENELRGKQEKQNSHNESTIHNLMNMLDGASRDNPELQDVLRGFMDTIMERGAGDEPKIINEKVAKRIAQRHLNNYGNVPIVSVQAERYRSAIKSANLWLDIETNFSSPKDFTVKILQPSGWINETMSEWIEIITPIVKKINQSMKDMTRSQFEQTKDMMDSDDADMKSMLGFNINGMQGMFPVEGGVDSILSVLDSLGSSATALQVGTAISGLGKEACCGTDQSLLLIHKAIVLVPFNIERFANEYSLPTNQVIQYFALRETATVRLFNAVPWLYNHLRITIKQYAQGIELDSGSIEEQMSELSFSDVDPMDTSRMQEVLNSASSIFKPTSPEQLEAQQDLEIVIGLIEGWVDMVTFHAGIAHIPEIVQVREVMSRRRITGHAGEKAFHDVIGLPLNAIKSNEAIKFWEKAYLLGGPPLVDRVWNHPDILPNSKAFQDPEAYFAGDESTFGKVRQDEIEIEHDWNSLLKE